MIRKIKSALRFDWLPAMGRITKARTTYRVTSIKITDGGLRMVGWRISNTEEPPTTFRVDKFRDSRTRFLFEANINNRLFISALINGISKAIFGKKCTRFSVDMQIPWRDLTPSQYNFYANNARLRFMRKQKSRLFYPSDDRTVLIGSDIVFTRSFRAEILGVGPKDIARLKVRVSKPRAKTTMNCLIGEYTISARDNGYALFKGLMSPALRVDDVNAHYVVEANNLDGVALGENMLPWGSYEHLSACIESDIVAFAWDKRNVLPLIIRHISESRWAEIKGLFLQHGVTALKGGVEHNYHKSRSGADAVLVSSERERKLFAKRFGFEHKDIFVTGFPRHDALIRTMQQLKETNTVLVFPTWRDYLNGKSSKDCAEMPWTVTLQSVLASLRDEGVETILILHQNAAHLANLFFDVVADIRPVTEFQPTLCQSRALVTDFSSVCFEATLLGKPTYFWTSSEIKKYLRKSYVSIPRDLPGLSFEDPAALAKAVAGRAKLNEDRSALYFAHKDDQACRRILEAMRAITRAQESTGPSWRRADHPITSISPMANH